MNRLNKKLRMFFVSSVLLLLFACGPAGYRAGMPALESGPKYDLSAVERQVHDLINMERQKNGLARLEWNVTLSSIARKHSQDMALRKYFSHESLDGQSFLHRYEKEGFTCLFSVGKEIHQGAENISQDNLFDSVTYRNGVPTYHWKSQKEIAGSIVQRWMESPGHRNNILFPHWRTEGIGIALTEEGEVLVTQNFC